MARQVIRVDVTSDTVCPWCFVGKKNLEKAIAATQDRYDVQVQWHPFFLNPDASREGVSKLEMYKSKFGAGRVQMIADRVGGVFASLGYQYSMGGLTGSSLDSHRLIALAAKQGAAKQNALVEELFLDYFTREKFLGDHDVLAAAALRAGVAGGAEVLADPHAELQQVLADERRFRKGVSGVPHFRIDGRWEISGAQPPQAFVDAFEAVGKSREVEADADADAVRASGACTEHGCH